MKFQKKFRTTITVLILTLLITIFTLPLSVSARKLYYLEEFYRLYSLPHRPVNEDYLRNIYWLRRALKQPFAPPIHALKPPESVDQYRRYRTLLKMHLRYLIVKNTVFLAARFDKHKPVFYNFPYKEDILKSLNIAEYLYQEALKDWDIVMGNYNNVAIDGKNRLELEFLEKMIYRIKTDELNYDRVITRQLDKIYELKEYFK